MTQQQPTENAWSAADGPHFSMPPEGANPPAWEEVDIGRFMPRRIRGSCQGRALG